MGKISIWYTQCTNSASLVDYHILSLKSLKNLDQQRALTASHNKRISTGIDFHLPYIFNVKLFFDSLN